MALRWQEGGELDLGQADWRPEFWNKTIPEALLHTHWFCVPSIDTPPLCCPPQKGCPPGRSLFPAEAPKQDSGSSENQVLTGHLGPSEGLAHPTSSRVMLSAADLKIPKGRAHLEAAGRLLAPLPCRSLLELPK